MKIKKTLLNLLFAIAATLSSHSLYAQNGIDTNKTEAAANANLLQLTKDVNTNTKAIAEIHVKVKGAGNLISEAARLQNQSRAVFVLGSAIGGIVLASTGNISAFIAITGISGLVATVDALLSTSKLSEAGNTLSGIIPNEHNQSQVVSSSSSMPKFEEIVSNKLTIQSPYGKVLSEEIGKKHKYQLICPDSINCEKYSIFQTLNFHDCKFQLDRMENIEDASYKMFTIQDLEKIDKEIDTNTKFQFLKEMGWIWSSSYGPNYGEIYCYNFSKHERASFLMTDLAQFFCVRVN
jgi:hypothetical protein